MASDYLTFVRRHASCTTWSDDLDLFPDDETLVIKGGVPWSNDITAHIVQLPEWLDCEPGELTAVPLFIHEHQLIIDRGELGFWTCMQVDPLRVLVALHSRFAGHDVASMVMNKCFIRATKPAIKNQDDQCRHALKEFIKHARAKHAGISANHPTRTASSAGNIYRLGKPAS